MCDAQVFADINREQFDALVHKCADQGIEVKGDEGEATGHHITLAYKFDEDAHTLTLQCTKKPFFVDCEEVKQHLRDLIEADKPAGDGKGVISE